MPNLATPGNPSSSGFETPAVSCSMPGVRPCQLRPGHGGERAGHGSATEA